MKEKKTILEIAAETRAVHILLSILLGFLAGASFLLVMRLPAADAYGKMFKSFTSLHGISYIIVYGVPYILTGLSVAFSFRTGVFNIGAEGQYVSGAIAAAVTAISFPDLPKVLLIPLCFLSAMAAGALCGLIVGFLKTKRGINEVLSMIMMNWLMFYLSNYITDLPGIKNEGSAEATKTIPEAARMIFPRAFIEKTGLCPIANWGILVAILAAVLVWILIQKTTLGFRLRAVGSNKNAAGYAGIPVEKSILISLAVSGALAGLAGALQLMGMSKRVPVYSSQEGFGFAGIVVALIGCSNPFGVIFAGLFYGFLTYGGTKLNLVGAPSQLVNVIIGTIVFFISISIIFRRLKDIKPGKKAGKEAAV